MHRPWRVSLEKVAAPEKKGRGKSLRGRETGRRDKTYQEPIGWPPGSLAGVAVERGPPGQMRDAEPAVETKAKLMGEERRLAKVPSRAETENGKRPKE